jgi:ribosome-associated protein
MPRHPRASELADADDAVDAGEAPVDERPSKTALKREAHDLQRLGEALAALSDERLAALAMPAELLDAVVQLKRTRSHEGRRRQLQYVGKLMRRADVEPLREAVAQTQLGTARDALALHQAERWREELARDDDALTRWLAAYPDSDAQRLRSLVRNARREAALPPEQRHGRAWRELFRFIRPHLDASDDLRDHE